jgi:DnaJ-class molecular chaperone
MSDDLTAVCDSCSGDGSHFCDTCGGNGFFWEDDEDEDAEDEDAEGEDCEECDGFGVVECMACEGEGRVLVEEE